MGTKVLCERCKKEVADREVVLTQKDVDEGKTVESKTQRRIASKDEVVKTQADVDAENSGKKVEPAVTSGPTKDEAKTEVDKSIENAEKNIEPAKPAKKKKKKKTNK